MTDLMLRTGAPLDEDKKLAYAGLLILKKMDLAPRDGGLTFSAVLPHELSPLDEVFQHLLYLDYVALDRRRTRWEITKQGLAYLGQVMDEAQALVDEFDEEELPDVLVELRRRRLDEFRARFLWGWIDGEFDDLVLFQEQRGVDPLEPMWALYLVSDEFFAELAKDLTD